MWYKDCLHKGCLLPLTRCRWWFLQTTCPLRVHRHSLGESQVLRKEGKRGSVGVRPQYSHFNCSQWGETNSQLDFWTLTTNLLSRNHSKMSKPSSLVLQETLQSLSWVQGSDASSESNSVLQYHDMARIRWAEVYLCYKKFPYWTGHFIHKQGRNASEAQSRGKQAKLCFKELKNYLKHRVCSDCMSRGRARTRADYGKGMQNSRTRRLA